MTNQGDRTGRETRTSGRHSWASRPGKLAFTDVAGPGAFLALDDVERHGLALSERLEAFGLDVTVVDEDLAAVVNLDEPKPLGIVEPLHLACCHEQGSFKNQHIGFANVFIQAN